MPTKTATAQKVQAVLFTRSSFPTAKQARSWLQRHYYRVGPLNEKDPERWEYEQLPRSDFSGQSLTVEPVRGHPGVSVRVRRGASAPVPRKNPLHPANIVDYEIRVKAHGDNDFRTVFYRTDLKQAVRDAKKWAKDHAEPGVVVLWQVREAVSLKMVANNSHPDPKPARKATKKRAKKRAKKKVTRKKASKKAPRKKVAKKASKKAPRKKVAKKASKKAPRKKTSPGKRARARKFKAGDLVGIRTKPGGLVKQWGHVSGYEGRKVVVESEGKQHTLAAGMVAAVPKR